MFVSGMTNLNAAAILQGHSDSALNNEGRQQALLLGAHFVHTGVVFSHGCSSDLTRAVETARLVLQPSISGDACHVVLTTDRRLRERSYGFYEGTSCKEFISAARKSRVHPEYYTPQSVEPPEQFAERIQSWFREFCTQADADSHVLVVAHGGSIRRLFAHLFDSNVCHFFGNRAVVLSIPKNTAYSTLSVSHYSQTGDSEDRISAKCEKLHCVDHLSV